MNKDNKIERLKDELYASDYIAIKASEGCDVSEHGEWKAERQAIRDEINLIMGMTDEEYYEAYPEEREEEIIVPEEELESGDEPYDIDVEQNNGEEGAPDQEI